MDRIKDHWIGIAIGAVFAILLIVIPIGVWYTDYSGKQTLICTVNDKDRTTKSGSNSSEARVYTDQCDVLTVNDRFFSGSNDSASLYSKIKVGQTYEFTTVGRRIPLLSTFPNIIEVRQK